MLKAGDTKVYDETGTNQVFVKTADGTTAATGATAFSTGAELTTTSKYKDDTNADKDNTAVTIDNLKDYIKGGVKVSDGTTTLTVLNDAKDATGAVGNDGVDDNDNSLITKKKLMN